MALVCCVFSVVATLVGYAKEPFKVPTEVTVKICIETVTELRRPNPECEHELDDVRWAYVRYDPRWPLKLPAVGGTIEHGRYTLEKPRGMIGSIPSEGAVFES